MTTESKIKAFVAFVSLAAFFFSVFQFLTLRSIEARKPYLERKLAWCEEAVESAAKIASSSNPSDDDVSRFWEMYWGVMIMIEREDVTDAMVAFGEALKSGEAAGNTAKNGENLTGLTGKSQDLANACRRELSREWSASWGR